MLKSVVESEVGSMFPSFGPNSPRLSLWEGPVEKVCFLSLFGSQVVLESSCRFPVTWDMKHLRRWMPEYCTELTRKG